MQTETYNWNELYETAGTSLVSATGQWVPYSVSSGTIAQSNTATPPTVTQFSYNYSADTKTLTLTFTLEDPDVTEIHVTVYAEVDGNYVVLREHTTVQPGVQASFQYALDQEPSQVYISFISEEGGGYPPYIPFFAPKYIVANSVIPINIDYSGNVIITVSNGYSISPLEVNDGYQAYVIAASSGPVGIVVSAQ